MRMGWPGFLIWGKFLLAALLGGTLSAVAQGQTDLIVKGEKVYAEKKCAACHAIKGKGGKIGGDLSQIGAKKDAAWLKIFIKDPKAVMPKAKMPAFKGTDEDLDAVVAYVASLKMS